MNSTQPEDSDETKRKRRSRRIQVSNAIFAACIGLVSFFNVVGNARFETYHKLDVIRLLTAGAGFGVALVLLIQFFVFPGPFSEAKKEKEI